MNSDPTISVLMPVYNAERYVAEAVESILAQTFTDFEFLIVDDGSTDGSLAILKRYAHQDPRIRYKSRPNTGLVVALNEMLAEARGEFIARMDADDIAFPERFDRQLNRFATDASIALVGSQVDIIDSDGDLIHSPHVPLEHDELEAALLSGKGQMIFHPAVMMRSASVRRLNGYREGFWPAEDLDLFLRLSESSQIVNLDDRLLQYREHCCKIGRKHRRQQADAVVITLNDAYRRRGLRRPEQQAASSAVSEGQADVYRTWAWWALGAKNIATARKHAIRALVRRPWSLSNWRVTYCALRGH